MRVSFLLFFAFTQLLIFESDVIGQEIRLIHFRQDDEIRIRVNGPGIATEGEGRLEIGLGSRSTVDLENKRMPFYGIAEGLNEIELVPYQTKELKAVNQAFSEGLIDLVAEALKESGGQLSGDAKQRLLDRVAEFQVSKEEKAFEILLPFQTDALKQVYFQRAFALNPIKSLSDPLIAGKLKLDRTQLKAVNRLAQQCKRVVKEVKTEEAESLKKLEAKRQQDIISVLSPGQVEKIEELLGRKID